MSIPRAKITSRHSDISEQAVFDWECSCGRRDTRGWWHVSTCAEHARKHVMSHLRTVGSLTADDIGKWIEVEGRKPFQVDAVLHEHPGFTRIAQPGAFFGGAILPSTPCRVTEERP